MPLHNNNNNNSNNSNYKVKKIDKSKLSRKTKKLKNFTFWVVIDNRYPDDPITFTTTRDEAIEALDQYLYLTHYKHFRLWCNVRKLPVDHGPNWVQYSSAVIMPEQTDATGQPLYSIIQADYAPNIIASLLRTMNGCIPLGTSFDTDEELEEQSIRFAAHSIPETDPSHEQALKDFPPLREPYASIEKGLESLFEDIGNSTPPQCASCEDTSCESNPNNPSRANNFDA